MGALTCLGRFSLSRVWDVFLSHVFGAFFSLTCLRRFSLSRVWDVFLSHVFGAFFSLTCLRRFSFSRVCGVFLSHVFAAFVLKYLTSESFGRVFPHIEFSYLYLGLNSLVVVMNCIQLG